MASVRSKNSKAELIVFSYLRKQRIYFQRHYKRAPGTPDIAQPRKKKAVFIDGDFWHGRDYEDLKSKNKISQFWLDKIDGNIKRDKVKRKRLIDEGWQYITIWESDINRLKARDQALESIRAFLTDDSNSF